MLEALDAGFGNPSSAHSAGEPVRSRLIEAREAVAHLIGAEPCSLFLSVVRLKQIIWFCHPP